MVSHTPPLKEAKKQGTPSLGPIPFKNVDLTSRVQRLMRCFSFRSKASSKGSFCKFDTFDIRDLIPSHLSSFLLTLFTQKPRVANCVKVHTCACSAAQRALW